MGRMILSHEVDAVMYKKSYLQFHLSLSTQLSFSLDRETASLPDQYFPSSKSRPAYHFVCLFGQWQVIMAVNGLGVAMDPDRLKVV